MVWPGVSFSVLWDVGWLMTRAGLLWKVGWVVFVVGLCLCLCFRYNLSFDRKLWFDQGLLSVFVKVVCDSVLVFHKNMTIDIKNTCSCIVRILRMDWHCFSSQGFVYRRFWIFLLAVLFRRLFIKAMDVAFHIILVKMGMRNNIELDWIWWSGFSEPTDEQFPAIVQRDMRTMRRTNVLETALIFLDEDSQQ